MNFSLPEILWLVMLIPSITFHEFMHGYAAYRLGDPTAKNAGRLTLNPLASIDPIGTVLLPLLMFFTGGPIFGYAKPVPYNPMYFKKLRQGEILVGLAGPSANLALALAGAALAWVGNFLVGVSMPLAYSLWLVGGTLALTNLVLMFFNLIPIPPLDGSSVIPLFLPDSAMRRWYELQRYSFVILIAILWLVPILLHVSPISTYFDYTVFPLLNMMLPRTALATLGA